MADWRSELEELLAHLNVQAPFEVDATAPERFVPDSSPSSSIPGRELALAPDEQAADGDEVRAVRSEIESTIRRVHLLAQAGVIDIALRDDVVFVLLALTRPRPADYSSAPTSPRSDASQEWQITSAAAALRFCRIVQRLIDSVSQ